MDEAIRYPNHRILLVRSMLEKKEREKERKRNLSEHGYFVNPTRETNALSGARVLGLSYG